MSSQAPNTTPASPPIPHGGNMDPNEIRLRQARTQQASGGGVVTAEQPSHGGSMDPNEARLRLAGLQQVSGSASPALTTQESYNTVASRGGFHMQQTETQSAQYGSSSHLINTPSPPASGSHMYYQNAQSPQSPPSGQYFPVQHVNQPPNAGQVQQPPQGPYPGLPNQVCYCHS